MEIAFEYLQVESKTGKTDKDINANVVGTKRMRSGCTTRRKELTKQQEESNKTTHRRKCCFMDI
jgi:hypothetical protein